MEIPGKDMSKVKRKVNFAAGVSQVAQRLLNIVQFANSPIVRKKQAIRSKSSAFNKIDLKNGSTKMQRLSNIIVEL